MKNNSNQNIESQDYFQILRFNDNSFPLVEFKIAQGDGSITSLRSNYELISDPGYDCERDRRFKLIYLFNEFNFFQANEALDIAKQAPGYEISTKYQWEFMDSADSFQDIESQQLILMIISIVCVFVFILMLLINCCTICGVDLPCIKGKGTQESNIFIHFKIEEEIEIKAIFVIQKQDNDVLCQIPLIMAKK
ncbi:unnamed protein product [Paramecium sonneborni]|uniref:Transmembrane protein n=1 Tax=Paramecium sonneborni TaxID=65129 RepID=A0A8S1PU26_9CILI|nr:unnamed protein product [Paramecium sonneborni]